MPSPDPGSKLGRYEIVGPLGEGGMGVVYRARDPRLHRDVAIKLLPEAYASDPERLSRFEREARAAAGLSHPNVLAVYDVGVHDDAPYLVTELLEGESLRDRLRRRPIPWSKARAIVGDVARGLTAAHEKGIVHRDLKPENVFVLPDGRAKILDFGLATFAPGPSLEAGAPSSDGTLDQLTREGAVVGTIGYMAPEQVAGRPVDARADIFSLGVMLYEMLTGRQPFRRETSVETLHAILKETPEEIDTGTLEAPPEVGRTVAHCLEKDPARRFQASSDLLFDLEGVGQEKDATVIPAPHVQPRIKALGVGVGIVAVLVILAVVFLPRETADPPSGGVTRRPVAIAVLPFEERGGSSDLAYLGFGLPDEIVTVLTYAEGVAVRPFSDSSRYVPPRPDLRQVGGELGASHVVVGQFGLEGDEVRVSVEAVELVTNQIVWRDGWSVSRSDLREVRTQTRERISGGLLAILGRTDGLEDMRSSEPQSSEAYDLYLRSQALSLDPVPNVEAIDLLERSLELDAEFAPAWLSLSMRLRFDNLLGTGEAGGGYARSVEALERATTLDPDLLPARVAKIHSDVEMGRHAEAYRAARALVDERPDSAEARSALAYALRYGGSLDESGRECDLARSLDPGGVFSRSCVWTFAHLREFDSALDTVESETRLQILDSLRADILMRMGDDEGALAAMADIGPEFEGIDLQRGCIQDPQPPGLAELIRDQELDFAGWGDPEALYWFAALMSRCGFADTAFRFVALAIDRSYCAAGMALDNDPLWDGLRGDPRFAEQRARARQCHERFVVERSQ